MAMEIRVLAKHGKGVREIACEVGVSRNTVRRYLRDGEAKRERGALQGAAQEADEARPLQGLHRRPPGSCRAGRDPVERASRGDQGARLRRRRARGEGPRGQAAGRICHTGPRGGTYTLTASNPELRRQLDGEVAWRPRPGDGPTTEWTEQAACRCIPPSRAGQPSPSPTLGAPATRPRVPRPSSRAGALPCGG